jgi:hypothetical protein
MLGVNSPVATKWCIDATIARALPTADMNERAPIDRSAVILHHMRVAAMAVMKGDQRPPNVQRRL